ncbi:hypothetical protein C8J57DRAFT_1252633 [Mycena rebaudengoi]|nr:hypothetical protein C8J57DRAFT_1252633 [Mycena rebaudengoi]
MSRVYFSAEVNSSRSDPSEGDDHPELELLELEESDDESEKMIKGRAWTPEVVGPLLRCNEINQKGSLKSIRGLLSLSFSALVWHRRDKLRPQLDGSGERRAIRTGAPYFRLAAGGGGRGKESKRGAANLSHRCFRRELGRRPEGAGDWVGVRGRTAEEREWRHVMRDWMGFAERGGTTAPRRSARYVLLSSMLLAWNESSLKLSWKREITYHGTYQVLHISQDHEEERWPEYHQKIDTPATRAIWPCSQMIWEQCGENLNRQYCWLNRVSPVEVRHSAECEWPDWQNRSNWAGGERGKAVQAFGHVVLQLFSARLNLNINNPERST